MYVQNMVPIHQVVRLLAAVQEKSMNHQNQNILRGSWKSVEIVMLDQNGE